MDPKESGKPSPPHFKECPTEIVARKYEAVQPSFFQIALARFKKRRDCKGRVEWMIIFLQRSEERRVGKECRSRWSPDHLKKKRKTLRETRSRATQAKSSGRCGARRTTKA